MSAKAKVIGLYGLPAAGKTTLLAQLKRSPEFKDFKFYEGSQQIHRAFPGGLEAFKASGPEEQQTARENAITTIGDECANQGKVGVVTGHYMFWLGDGPGQPIVTDKDLQVYTHIIYLETPADVLAQRVIDDNKRGDVRRKELKHKDFDHWQGKEMGDLRGLCLKHNILFINVSTQENRLDQISKLIQNFRDYKAVHNFQQIQDSLKSVVKSKGDQLARMLVFDADKTLAPQDTGEIFWKSMTTTYPLKFKDDPLRVLFSSNMKYSYNAFRQASLLYEEVAYEEDFDTTCNKVASKVNIHPEMLHLLKQAEKPEHVGAIVITSGLRRVWEIVLRNNGLTSTHVIGNGRIFDEAIVTPSIKAQIVTMLKKVHRCNVWAFGDSPLDIEMLHEADKAMVVVGELSTRSTTMESALKHAVDHEGLSVCQVPLPKTSPLRLDPVRAPQIDIASSDFQDFVLSIKPTDSNGLQIINDTGSGASKLLSTPMRDSTKAGPALRKAHELCGYYLATAYVTDVIGLEEQAIPHVQCRTTSGFRLLDESNALIVALMRGGDPMASGIQKAFPLAMYLHANRPEDVKGHNVESKTSVILVDSVVNTGRTVSEFVERVRSFNTEAKIVVVAGVVQHETLEKERPGSLANGLKDCTDVTLVALRVSHNKYTGSGGTDTGNRLFNTTYLTK